MEQKDLNLDLMTLYAAKYDEARLKTVVFDDYLDPYLLFKDFFSASTIDGHLLALKKMYRSAIRLTRIKAAPADVIFDRELFSCLLNAAWVIDQTGIRFAQTNVKYECVGQSGGALSSEKIARYLTDVEVADPYLGINTVFKEMDLQKLHLVLNEWLKLALCKNEFEEDYRGRRKLYKGIVKVFICCWLIYEGEIVSLNV